MAEEVTPDPMTFDLVGVLSGRDYPSIDIEVYFDEALGFSIYEINKMIRSADLLGDTETAEKLSQERENLVRKTEKEKYVITIQSVPESVRRKIIEDVQEEYPEKQDILGRPQPNPKADSEFTRRLWKAYLRKVTSPEGAVRVIDDSDVSALMANAPATVHTQINEAISELRTGAEAGFEFVVKEMDFLSQASPEG